MTVLIVLGCWFIASGTLGTMLIADNPTDWRVTIAGRLAVLLGGPFLALGWYA